MDEEVLDEHNCDDNAIYYEFVEDGHRYHGYECGVKYGTCEKTP